MIIKCPCYDRIRLLTASWCISLILPIIAFAADPVSVQGTVVDDETGEPITSLMIQAGKFDQATPGEIVWGWSERRTSSETGRFSTRVRWHEGWTARLVVDGYLPQAIITESPPEGNESIEVEIRLKRGRLLVGRVIDHDGKPVDGAMVYPVGPGGINVYAGKAMESHSPKVDARAKGIETDKDGKFELPTGNAKNVVVTSKSINAWAVNIPEQEDKETSIDEKTDEAKAEFFEIKLPEPAKLTINLDIEGSEEESKIFYQMLTHYMEGFEKVQSSQTLPIENGGKLEMFSMTPGKYQFWRERWVRFDSMGMGGSMDRMFIELKPGEDRVINMVRKKGSRATGTVTWPEGTDLSGVAVKIRSLKSQSAPWDAHEYKTTYDIQQVKGTAELDKQGGNSRKFRTDMLLPGEYEIFVEAYTPLTEAQKMRTGIIGPSHTTTAKLIVPDMSDPEPVELKLEATR